MSRIRAGFYYLFSMMITRRAMRIYDAGGFKRLLAPRYMEAILRYFGEGAGASRF